MDEQKKQKMMVGILIAAVLGAGSYYVFLRDSGENSQIQTATGPTVRKNRTSSNDTTKTGNTRKTRAKKPDAATPTGRKVREKTANKGPTERKSRRGGSKRVKKKELKPMG